MIKLVNFSQQHKSFLLKVSQELSKTIVPIKMPITVIAISLREMQKLNSEFRNKNEPTDVLSFEDNETNGGEVYVCIEIVKRQAEEFKVSLEEELMRIVIHGILHLLGYDHKGKFGESNEEMFKKQEELLGKSIKIYRTTL